MSLESPRKKIDPIEEEIQRAEDLSRNHQITDIRRQINELESGTNDSFSKITVKGEVVHDSNKNREESIAKLEERLRTLENQSIDSKTKATPEPAPVANDNETPEAVPPAAQQKPSTPEQAKKETSPVLDNFTRLQATQGNPESNTLKKPENVTMPQREQPSIPQRLKEVIPTIKDAESFDELYDALKQTHGIAKGFAGFDGYDQRLGAKGYAFVIEQVRNGEVSVESLPLEYGIREKVRELLKSNANKPKTEQASVTSPRSVDREETFQNFAKLDSVKSPAPKKKPLKRGLFARISHFLFGGND